LLLELRGGEAVTDVRVRPTQGSLRKKRGSGFRPDIEGLRAIAVLSVLVYHLRSEVLPGGFIGVDIFFVISGFLITSHLVREHEKTGRISLTRFYARRMVRLIPAATVVLLATAVATLIFVPRILWKQIGIDLVGSATYVINWMLAARSVDYLAEDSIVSPVQHFWSLAVEEQFYLIWPLLIIIAGTVAVRRELPKRRVMAIGATAIVVLSFAAAVFSEVQGDVTAYFSTFTRLWELAAGALAALAIARMQRTAAPGLLRALFWVGILLVLGSVALVALPRYWPGAVTLLPVVGTVLVLLTGGTDRRTIAERALSLRPLTWTGGISYSLYLWHWPIIVIAGYVFADLDLRHAVLIVVLSVGLAWLSSILVENPIRFSRWATARWRNGLILGISCGAITILAGVSLVVAAPSNVLQAPKGAEAAGGSTLSLPVTDTPMSIFDDSPEWVLPSPVEAPGDVPSLYADGCQTDQASVEVNVCSYGNLDSDQVIALVGDSKAGQWQPALEQIARESSMKLVIMTKSACAFSTAPSTLDGVPYSSCEKWNDGVLRELAQLRPDVVVTSQVRALAHSEDASSSRSELATEMAEGIAEQVSRVVTLGARVVLLADTPQTPGAVYECVAEHSDDLTACGYPLEKGIAGSAVPTQLEAADILGAPPIDDAVGDDLGEAAPVTLIDMTGYICPPQVDQNCPAVIGNSLIYRQGSHLTASYVETLNVPLRAMLDEAELLPANVTLTGPDGRSASSSRKGTTDRLRR
jgi:peptidoglycan/LPS O-acetylase OafA/YrhL